MPDPEDLDEIVSSSAISRMGYEFLTGELIIQFTDGSVYTYGGVPENVVKGFLSASSKGSFFNANIRNSYGFTKS